MSRENSSEPADAMSSRTRGCSGQGRTQVLLQFSEVGSVLKQTEASRRFSSLCGFGLLLGSATIVMFNRALVDSINSQNQENQERSGISWPSSMPLLDMCLEHRPSGGKLREHPPKRSRDSNKLLERA